MYEDREVIFYLSELGFDRDDLMISLGHFDRMEEIFEFSTEDLMKLGLYKKSALKKFSRIRGKPDFSEFEDRLERAASSYITILDREYPESLREIPDPPVILYYKGDIGLLKEPSIAMVGARKCSQYGAFCAEKFASQLVSEGLQVVSGLAQGIDSISHRAALSAGGSSIGVLGTGIDIIYPRSNRGLYREMEERGLIITEYSLGKEGLPYRFPLRNRIISGLSLGVLVVEAKEASGSLITASRAGDQGRAVMAVPGNINSYYSVGTNALIRDGARLVMDVGDILEEINFKKIEKDDPGDQKNDLTERELAVYNTLTVGKHIDQILEDTGLDISSLQSTLTILELKGLIKESGSQIFVRN